MTERAFRFVKIKNDTGSEGRGSLWVGGICLAVLAALVIVSFYRRGNLPPAVGGIGYLSGLFSLGGLYKAVRLWQNGRTNGRRVQAAITVCGISSVLHIVLFLAGCIVSVL